MKLLIDTNVFIPLEPGSPSDVEDKTPVAAELFRLAAAADVTVFLHPAGLVDLARDKDSSRRAMRLLAREKYPALPSPPAARQELLDIVGSPEKGSNDWVDIQHLAALAGDAVDLLVTDDIRLQKKAERVGLIDQVLGLDDALSALRALFDTTPQPPPAVVSAPAHVLDENDPIFGSFRRDYGEVFDPWLRKCKRDHRQTWIIKRGDSLDAVCIVKKEDDAEYTPAGRKTLKVCTFKVAEQARGLKYGELLLKTLFAYLLENHYHWTYVTVFEKHAELVALFEEFGFRRLEGQTTKLGELVLSKPMDAREEPAPSNALEYNRRFGPAALPWEAQPTYIVPILPKFHDALFPELAEQMALLAGSAPFGNGILKAYLCNSPTHQIPPGSNLLFYKSRSNKTVQVLGLVERTMRSDDASVIAAYVARRTVYSFKDIDEMAQRPVLAVLFRQTRLLNNPVHLDELVKAGFLKGHPQSIVKLREEASRWLQQRTEAQS